MLMNSHGTSCSGMVDGTSGKTAYPLDYGGIYYFKQRDIGIKENNCIINVRLGLEVKCIPRGKKIKGGERRRNKGVTKSKIQR